MNMKQTLRRWLVIAHRWMAIATCLLFVIWFASGLVMMYVEYPRLTAAEKLARLERIDWNRIAVTPEWALQGLSLTAFPQTFRLVMINGEPVYLLDTGERVHAISAIDGRTKTNVGRLEAIDIVTRVEPHSAVASATTLERDQWSVAGTFDAHRPLHKVALSDAEGTELYISSATGEIVLDSTRRERAWNWVGAVLHWIYFRDLRANGPLWSQVVMWTSGIGIFVAITGLWLGIDRLRLRRRNSQGSITPYRGWMAWHHLAGIIGGVFLLTWIFSGWLSMGPPVPWDKPFDMDRRAAAVDAYSGNSEARFPASTSALQTLNPRSAREASFVWILGEPRVVLSDEHLHTTLIDPRSGAEPPIDESALIAAAPQLLPDARLTATLRLEHEDAYWYSRRHERTLPVLRFIFDDADRTWVHVDPQTGKIVGWMRNSDRIHRWLFNALHSFDFRWLLNARPVWDLLLWILSLAGLAISASGVVIGWRHLRR